MTEQVLLLYGIAAIALGVVTLSLLALPGAPRTAVLTYLAMVVTLVGFGMEIVYLVHTVVAVTGNPTASDDLERNTVVAAVVGTVAYVAMSVTIVVFFHPRRKRPPPRREPTRRRIH